MTQQIASAVDQAMAAHARGTALPAPRLRNMEQRHSVRHVADLSRRLPGWEVSLLAQATDEREQALAKARAGDVVAARAQLLDAARFVEERIPSLEGRLSARSFHAAAAAFVEHAEGRHDVAYDLMIEALALCRRLRVEYGHSVEVRRVHLARNVARVAWCLDRHEEAWTLCMDLLAYVWSAGAAWPLGEATALGVAERETLRDDERMFLTDQLLSEAISAAADARRRAKQLPDEPCDAGAPRLAALPARATEVLRLCRSTATGDAASVVTALASYFEAGPGELPMTWRRAEALFAEVSHTPVSG